MRPERIKIKLLRSILTWLPERLLRHILTWFPERAQKRPKWSSWWFWPGSRNGHRKNQSEAPEAYSGLVSGVDTERVKMDLLRPILAWFPKRAQRESKLSSWGLFWHGFRSGHRNDQNQAPEAYSGLAPELGTERLKVKLLRLILAWFQEWAQKGWKWSSWGRFWPGSRNGHRKNQSEALEAYSGLVSGVGTERVKMELLRPILAWFPKRAQRESKLSSWGLFWHGFRSGHRNDQSEALEGSCFNHHTTLWDVCFRVQLLRFLISCGNLYHWVVIETRPMRLSLVETYKVPHILSCENLKPYVWSLRWSAVETQSVVWWLKCGPSDYLHLGLKHCVVIEKRSLRLSLVKT